MIGAPEAAPELPLWRAERILFDAHGLLVVDKPPGVPVHGGDESLSHSVVARLGAWLRSLGRSDYLGVHSRLDQGTSGALAFVTDPARNAEVAAHSEQHAVQRTYVAIVELGRAPRLGEAGSIELLLEHDGEKSRVVERGGKRAVTRYRVLERQGQRARVELELETGRSHQIRVSLAHLGAPILGDDVYGGTPAERLFLHSVRLAGGHHPSPIECPAPPAFARALSGRPFDSAEAREALLDAACLRAPLLEKTSALRLVNGEGDGLPGLTVDAYGAFAVLNVYDEAWLAHHADLGAALLSLGYAGVYTKKRVRADLRAENASELASELPSFGEAAPAEFLVRENGVAIAVQVADGLSSGLFVDQRDNRKRLVDWIAERVRLSSGPEHAEIRMLNLFSYTSSFSVVAALCGARTTSVDLSGRALARSRRNFELNGLDPSVHQFFKDDALKMLARALRRGDVYDFIVLDPPSFSTVGKGTFSVKGRYVEAAALCFGLLAPQGRLLAVTNHTATPRLAFRRMLQEAAERSGRKLASLKDLPTQLDCPDSPDGPWPSKSLLATLS